MASPTPAPPPPPRASFNSLPTEIKAQIVKLAKEQDKNYRARNEKATKKEKSAAQALKRGWHGRSTNALFLVNKELSDLRASGCLENSFRHSTLPRHCRHFRRIVLDENASADELDCVLSLLLLSTSFSITRMLIHGDAAEELFGGDSAKLSASASPSNFDSTLGFRQAARSITDLTLLDFPFHLAAPALPFFTKPHQINSRPNEDGTLGTLPDEWSSFDWDSGPSPKRLKIDVGEGPFELSEWRLVEGMSRRLEVLEMVVGEEGLSNAPPVLPSLVATFPHLHTLRLTAGASVITKLLPAWSASPLKSLTLSLTSLALAHVADDSPLADALEPHLSTLSSAIITFPARLYTPTSPRLQKRVKFCAARNIGTATHNLDQDFSLSHLSRGVVSDVAKRKYHTGVACCAMDKVLEFAQARLARLRLDGDLEGAEEMLPLLERIAERLAVQRD